MPMLDMLPWPRPSPACQQRTVWGKDWIAWVSSTVQCHDAVNPLLCRFACAWASAPRLVLAVSWIVMNRRGLVPANVFARDFTSCLLIFMSYLQRGWWFWAKRKTANDGAARRRE